MRNLFRRDRGHTANQGFARGHCQVMCIT
jgi:hypothetical protein